MGGAFFGSLQWFIMIAISVGALIASVWGLIDASRFQKSAYIAAGKQTKIVWVLILVAATAVSIISMPAPIGSGSGIFGFLGLASIVAVAVYFAGVRPALLTHGGRGGGHSQRGGGSTGGW